MRNAIIVYLCEALAGFPLTCLPDARSYNVLENVLIYDFFVLLLQKCHKTLMLEHKIWGKLNLCSGTIVIHIWLQKKNIISYQLWKPVSEHTLLSHEEPYTVSAPTCV